MQDVETAARAAARDLRQTRRQIDQCRRSVLPHRDAEVFMDVSATATQIAAIARTLATTPEVTRDRRLGGSVVLDDCRTFVEGRGARVRNTMDLSPSFWWANEPEAQRGFNR